MTPKLSHKHNPFEPGSNLGEFPTASLGDLEARGVPPFTSLSPKQEAKFLCIDLCCGLKGSSSTFIDSADWEVITVDIERKFKPSIIADVRYLPLKENLNPTLLLASPPCQRFSMANPKWPMPGIKLAMETVGACFEAVAALKPRFWLIENPRGRLRKLAPITPNMTIFYSDYDREYPCQKPTDLWTNIPLKMAPHQRRPYSGRNGHLFDRAFGRNPSERAKVPFGVSKAIKESVEASLCKV